MEKARVTFPTLYPEGSLGHDDLSSRDGLYFEARNEYELRKQIIELATERQMPVDVQKWPTGTFKMRILPIT
jgi:hypothetical protein